MNITYNEKTRVFALETGNTGYYIAIVDDEQFLGHVHFGKRLDSQDELSVLLCLRGTTVTGLLSVTRSTGNIPAEELVTLGKAVSA